MLSSSFMARPGALAFVEPSTLLWIEFVAFLILVALSSLFSASEVAFLTLGPARRRRIEESGGLGAAAVVRLGERPQRFLITILIANNLVNIAAAALATGLAITLFGHRGVAIATGVTTLLVLTFGEIVPKTYATLHNERVARLLAPLLWTLQRGLYPIVRMYETFTNWLLRRFGAPDPQAAMRQFTSEEELLTLITVGAEEGLIEQSEERMLHRVIEMGDTVTREIMVPRVDVVALPADVPLSQVRRTLMNTRLSRLPAYMGSIDHVVGVISVRDSLARLAMGGAHLQVRDLMREPYVVPDSLPVAKLLAGMQERRQQMAIVLDEHGGTAGIVTLKDVLEEIVGDLFDEHERPEVPIQQLDERHAIVDAKVRVDELNEALGTNLPEDESYATVGGFVTAQLGHMGQEGERVEFEGAVFHVLHATRRRIGRVRVDLPEPRSEMGDDGDEEAV